MMVELSHTVVAQVAVSRFGRPKDQARLTELQSVDRQTSESWPVGGLALSDQVAYPLVLMLDVEISLVYGEFSIFRVKSGRNDSRINDTCPKHQSIACHL